MFLMANGAINFSDLPVSKRRISFSRLTLDPVYPPHPTPKGEGQISRDDDISSQQVQSSNEIRRTHENNMSNEY